MSVDSGSASMAARLGIKPGMVVQELGWDEDADEDLRDSIVEVSGSEMVDEDTDEVRSEEHTSELQSRQYLVCRLLLEKKKKKNIKSNTYTASVITRS